MILNRAALFLPVAAVILACGSAHAEGRGTYVIGAGNEKLFLQMTNPGPGGFAGGWKLDGVSIKDTEAELTYVSGRKKVVLALAHPSAAKRPAASTEKFAIVKKGTGPGSVPGDLLAALVKRMKKHEGGFEWTLAAGTRNATKSRAGPEGNGGKTPWQPVIPREAVPYSNMSHKGAGGGEVSDVGDDCREAEALKVMVTEGRSREAGKAAPELTPKSPRCLVFLHLNIAHANDDDKAMDAAAKTALKGYPDDRNILYLWGYHYYRKAAFDRAVPIWEKLVAIDFLYPAVAGQYGTAMLASGKLDPKGIAKQVQALEKKPHDPMASFLAGMGYYYQHEYSKAKPLLEVARKAMPHESRAGLYLAMSEYFLGDRKTAERIFEELEPYAYHDPDIYYCRSLIYRKRDLPRAIREMEKFVGVFLGEKRLSFGPEKVQKALSDLERMKKGEIPELNLPHEPLQPAL